MARFAKYNIAFRFGPPRLLNPKPQLSRGLRSVLAARSGCLHCGGFDRIGKIAGKMTRIGLYKCYQCRKQFTVRGSVPLSKTATSRADLQLARE
jgi:hypothetical protein